MGSETTTPPDPFQLCGSTIEGKYRIASVVGDGGFGVVYRGVHKGFGELIAVKCLKLGSTLEEKQRDALLEQLKDEGRILHRLSRATSGIVQALDVGAFTTPGGIWVPYLVLEWLEGETLAEFMKARLARGEGGLDLAGAIQLLEPAARALAVAHAQRVAHRDVKPANLFVTEVGGVRTLKVLDFGIAKLLTSHPSVTAALEATKLGPTAFTPRYGAPEQFNKTRGASGPWTDVFALALILVELVTGKRALDGDDPTQLYIASADPVLRPTLRARGAPALDGVEEVLEKALAVEPKHRYGDAGEFWDVLVAAAAAGGVKTSTRVSTPSPVGTPHTPGPGPPPTAGPKVPETESNLATAEFAAQRSLDVSTEPSQKGGAASASAGAGLEPTVPVESLRGNVAAAAVRAGTNGSGAPEPAKAQRPAGGRARDDDSMVETPVPARGNQPLIRRSGGAFDAGTVVAAEVPGAPRAQRAPVAARRSPWGWIAAVLVLGGGALGVVWWNDRDSGPTPGANPKASATPSGRAHGGRTPTGSGIVQPSASPSASAAASSSASSLPPVAPEDMVYVPPGAFTIGMGATAREVVLTRGFFIERSEVTVRAYEACMAKSRCSPANHVVVPPPDEVDRDAAGLSAAGTDEYAEAWGKRCNEPRHASDHPINCVDFSSADSYCRWKNRRLPTEAEWELAARGVAARPFPWGSDAPECGRACYAKNTTCRGAVDVVATCPVGQPKGDATSEGILGLGGNVAEWVADGWASPAAGGTDPQGAASAPLRVVRGGSFLDEDDRLRATSRAGFVPSTAHVSIGFRCVQDVP